MRRNTLRALRRLRKHRQGFALITEVEHSNPVFGQVRLETLALSLNGGARHSDRLACEKVESFYKKEKMLSFPL